MYRTIRNLHLLLALLIGGFLLIYGISAVQMAHSRWFHLKPALSDEHVRVSGRDARSIARELATSQDIRGELKEVQTTAVGLKFVVERPGVLYRIDYSAATGRAHVRTERRTWFGLLNRIHHLAGLGKEWGPLNAWGTAVAAVSILLIAIAITGIYLWFKTHGERRVGTVLLVVSLGYSLPLIVLLRLGQ